ncbi:hypothetical protein DWZ50_13115 [Mediterraneibacter gnavus]|uniref:Uncharacterized protein n=1 Tax=Mediterraneibacter gnavus TaxID=33038 RepID=A0A415S7E5_MEDGN|nr:hypothetical protein DWZ50_13115 [Mediterraneibacter gnavus]DAM15492.1 MAG TPA: hypothetical protein [Caudoviricetes sp.]
METNDNKYSKKKEVRKMLKKIYSELLLIRREIKQLNKTLERNVELQNKMRDEPMFIPSYSRSSKEHTAE